MTGTKVLTKIKVNRDNLERLTTSLEALEDGKTITHWYKKTPDSKKIEVHPRNPSRAEFIIVQDGIDVEDYVTTQQRETYHNAYEVRLVLNDPLIARVYEDRIPIALDNVEYSLWLLQFMQI